MSDQTYDFGDGPVPAKRHINPDGSTGGWVANSAQVYGNAWVYGDAQVSGDARVSDNARVFGNAQVFGDAWVYGNARVYGNAQVSGDARVSDNAWVYGDAQVSGDARVFGDAQVFGNARVYGDAWEKSPLQIQGTKHFVCMCTRKLLNIGCTRLTIDEWKKKGIILGEQNGYTTEQIAEYRLYIELAAKLYPPIEEEKDL